MPPTLFRQEVLQGGDYGQNWIVKGALCSATAQIQTATIHHLSKLNSEILLPLRTQTTGSTMRDILFSKTENIKSFCSYSTRELISF